MLATSYGLKVFIRFCDSSYALLLGTIHLYCGLDLSRIPAIIRKVIIMSNISPARKVGLTTDAESCICCQGLEPIPSTFLYLLWLYFIPDTLGYIWPFLGQKMAKHKEKSYYQNRPVSKLYNLIKVFTNTFLY